MRKIDKFSKSSNLILCILYIPLSAFSILLSMASESTLDATNPLYINLVNIFSMIALFVPLLCIAGILISVFLRKKGRYALSIVAQFFPLVVFLLNLILLVCADMISM